jgi:hypothetical protein
MVKAAWWMDLARTPLGIDGFKQPFVVHFAGCGMYTAPPGTPNMGFGDLAFRPVQPSWSFVWCFTGEAKQQLRLERERAGVVVDYAAFESLCFRQWTGYDPPPAIEYLKSSGNALIPDQWHVEATTVTPRLDVFTVTVIRPYRKGEALGDAVSVSREGERVIVQAAGKRVVLRAGAVFVRVTR